MNADASRDMQPFLVFECDQERTLAIALVEHLEPQYWSGRPVGGVRPQEKRAETFRSLAATDIRSVQD